ncbi:MAG: peptide ABC transporter substrate-binding protein [Candidatus Eremiobacteraeota bacterium]|nr:peptide ABC transporter substrate-binding protein [Candidatus Eremiobacteraeota bacterium]
MPARSLRIAAAIVVAVVLCACTKVSQTGGEGSEPTATKTHVLRIADGTGDVPTLNPHLFSELTLGFISQLTQAYLVKYDSHNQPFPELVTEVPTQANGGISKDGDTITWHLRKGVKWSDGAPFDGDDVIFTVGVIMNPANNEIGRDGWNLITKMDEPDKYTVVFHLKHPYAAYLPTFFGSAGANPSVLPKHLLAQYPNINNVAYNSKPVGIGPFRVTAWKRADSIVMEANPYYFRGMPKLKEVVYKLIPSRETLLTQVQTGEVDLWPYVQSGTIPKVLAITKLKTDYGPSPLYAHLDFNLSHPIVADIRVRQAIEMAIDRKTLADKITQGYSVVQESVVPSVLPIAPTAQQIPLVPYDVAKAQALLDAAGWKIGADGIRVKNGQRLSLEFPYYTGSAIADATVELLRTELKAVGVEIQTRQFAPQTYFLQPNGIIYGGKFDITLYLWQSDPIGEMSNLWECNQFPPNGQNMPRFCDPKLDALLEQFKNTYDPEQHRKILLQEAQIIAANTPTIVLYVLDQAMTYNRNLTGFHPGAWTAFDQMMDVDI